MKWWRDIGWRGKRNGKEKRLRLVVLLTLGILDCD
jgi:hypothetical protein